MTLPGRLPRWMAWTIIAVVSLLALAALVSRGGESSYKATAIIAGVPRKGTTIGSDLLALANSRYVGFITSPTTQAALAEREGIPVSLIESAEVMVQPATNNIFITAEADTPGQAAVVANILATAAIQYSGSDDLIKQELVAPAVTNQ